MERETGSQAEENKQRKLPERSMGRYNKNEEAIPTNTIRNIARGREIKKVEGKAQGAAEFLAGKIWNNKTTNEDWQAPPGGK